MSMKISASQSAVAYHVLDGAFTFPYAVDAHCAVRRFPKEWSLKPWSFEAEVKAREAAGEQVAEMTPEEQAAIDEHAAAVAAANERLKDFRAKKAEEKKEAEQVAADEALVKSPAPRPEVRRALTPAQARKRAAETDDERIVREKAEEDKLAAASANGAPITS